MTHPFGGSLAVVMFVAAARAEATTVQRDRMRLEALPFLQDEALPASEAYRACLEKVAEIMGPQWAPKGEWREWIDKLLTDVEPEEQS